MEDASARGNWGMKDMIMALKWVRQYIGRFGADPYKITLLGHGSGASMVSLAMMDRDVRGTTSTSRKQHAGSMKMNEVKSWTIDS